MSVDSLECLPKHEEISSDETYDDYTRRKANQVKQLLSQHRHSLSQREMNSRERKKLLHGYTLEEIEKATNEICKHLEENHLSSPQQ